jgi:Na+/H+-dicarboxylate symporter
VNFSDRFRTAINVFGDSIGCAIVQHLSRKELRAFDEKQIIDENNSNKVFPLVVSDIKFETTHDNDKDNVIDRTCL